MPEHLPYYKISPQPYQNLFAAARAIKIDPGLKHLVDLRVSQINGCAFCINMHIHEALTAGESQRRLNLLSAWREVPDEFTPAERAAFAWAEALTRLPDSHGLAHEEREKTYAALSEFYSSEQIVELGYAVALINAWNRLAIGFHAPVQKS